MRQLYLLLVLFVCSSTFYAQTVNIDHETLGLTTNTFQEGPIDPDDDYSYSQSIYLQSEINQAGSIYSITFYTNGNLYNSNDLVVYMGEKTEGLFASTSDWMPLASLTQVYSGTFEVYNNQVVLELDTPFAYSNTANLVIAVDENAAGNDNNGSDFICHAMTYSTSFGIMLHYGGTTNEDPASPPTSAFLDNYRADISLNFTPISCYAPTGLTVSSIEETTADISWTDTSSNWDYVVQEAGTGNPDAGTIHDTATATVSVDELTGNTPYEVYLRQDCGVDDYSDWIGPVFFRTNCAAVIDDFSEDFAGMEEDLVTPYCWSTIITTTGTDTPSAYLDSNWNTPDNKYYYMSADEEDTVMLISPNSSTLGDGTQRVEFVSRSSDDAYATPLLVGTMSDPADANTFTLLRSYVLTEEDQTYFVNVPSGTDTHLAFKHGANYSNNITIYLDDIVVTTQPSCLEVYDLVVDNIGSDSADLSWTVDSQQTQTEWIYVVQYSGTGNPDAGTPITASTNPTNVIDLDSNTEYEIYVKANCDAAGSDGSAQSAWTGPVIFRTGCSLPIDDFSENFDTMPDELEVPFCWNVIAETTGSTAPTGKVESSSSQAFTPSNYYHMSLGNDDTFYLVAPESTLIADGTHRVEFAAKVNSTGGGPSTITVGLMSDPNDATTFVEIGSRSLTNSSSETANYTLFDVNIPLNTTHQNLAFKIESESTYNVTVYLDSISVSEQPTCQQPLNVAVEGIEFDAFDVVITPDYQTQTEWELVVKQTTLNFNPALENTITTSTTTTQVTLDSDGLPIAPNAPYRIFVRSQCDADGSEGTGYSEWFGPVDIVTACSSYEMDSFTYPEMFEAANNDDIIPCWSALVSEGTGYVRYSSIQEYDGASSVRLYYPTQTPTSAYQMLVSPAFTDLGMDKQISFWVFDDNNATLSVGTMSDPTDATTFTEIERFNNGVDDDFETPGSDTTDDIPNDAWTQLTVDFASFSGTDQHIAFRVLRSNTYTSFYIDTFTYEINPSLSTVDVNTAENGLSIYPNPATTTLNIKGTTPITQVEIYTVNGQHIHTNYQPGSSRIDVSNLSQGMYFVKIWTQNHNGTTFKFIKD